MALAHAAHELFDPRHQGEQHEGAGPSPEGLVPEEARELIRVVTLKLAGQYAREFVAQRGGKKPDAHDHARQPLWCELGHGGEADRTE